MPKKTSTRPSRDDLAPRAIGVREVSPSDLYPNPHNPRLLFDREPLKILKESIAKVGILVPLTVYKEARTSRYIILDGQRRWIVAQDLGLSVVPVNEVAEPSLVQNIVTMFQIHKLREDWELMPTALKLEVLMDELEERNESKLAALTGLDKAVVSRCKKLLSYSRNYQDMMLDPDPERRVKADFFIELYAVRNDRFINGLKWFNRNEFTDKMLARYEGRKGIKAVTDFRTMKQHINNARRAGKEREIGTKLRAFVYNDELTLDTLSLKAADVSATARKLQTQISGLDATLRELEPADFYGQEELWMGLERLLRLIMRKLRDAGRRVKL
jgi:ParB/RepB/Spo0J family partition protein